MSLNNVYHWDKDGWKKITAEEFVKLYPGIKKSAKEKYFWCEMCGQYVGLATGDFNKPHFRHSSTESQKDCDDRAKNFSKSDWIKYSKPSYDLPLKIYSDNNDFYFKIGLPALPNQLFDKVKKCRIKIQSSEKILNHCDLADYLIEGETTWIEVGSYPEDFYSLTLEPEILDVHFYWNEKNQGVDTYGTLFDKNTGRKILNDADVKVNSKYYLLTVEECSSEDVQLKELIRKKSWFLYEVEATELTEQTAKFFLKYHCRLTANPVSISPIYPVYTRNEDVVYCDAEKIFVYFAGNAKVKFFPQTVTSILLEEKNSKLIEVFCRESQNMTVAGRSQILQRLCIRKNSPTAEINFSKLEVKDFSGRIISSGVYHKLPENSTLQIYNEFDIHVVVAAGNVIEKKFFRKAETFFDISGIKFGTEIKIFQGLDCIWSISYERETKGIFKADDELYSKLERGKGKKIKIPHTLGSVSDKLKNYPKVKNWLYKNIRAGFVAEESYLLLRKHILGELNRG